MNGMKVLEDFTDIFRNNLLHIFFKIGVLKNFAIFTRKNMC